MASKRTALKSSEAKLLLHDFKKRFPGFAGDIQGKQMIEEVLVDGGKVFLLEGRPFAISTANGLFPSLTNEELLKTLPTVVVDMGAIPHVCSGADVMRPGIKEVRGEFVRGDVLLVKDIRFGKAIGLCVAETSSDSMRGMSKGKAAKNVHYVGDQFWQALKAVR